MIIVGINAFVTIGKKRTKPNEKTTSKTKRPKKDPLAEQKGKTVHT